MTQHLKHPWLQVCGGCSMLWVGNSQRIAFWSNTMLVWHIISFVKEVCCLRWGCPRRQILGQGSECKQLICKVVLEAMVRKEGKDSGKGSWVNGQVTALGDWVSILPKESLEDSIKVLQSCHLPSSLPPTQELGSYNIYIWATNYHLLRDAPRGIIFQYFCLPPHPQRLGSQRKLRGDGGVGGRQWWHLYVLQLPHRNMCSDVPGKRCPWKCFKCRHPWVPRASSQSYSKLDNIWAKRWMHLVAEDMVGDGAGRRWEGERGWGEGKSEGKEEMLFQVLKVSQRS